MTNEDQIQLAQFAARAASIRSQAEYLEGLAARIAARGDALATVELLTAEINVPGLALALDHVNSMLVKIAAHAHELDAELSTEATP